MGLLQSPSCSSGSVQNTISSSTSMTITKISIAHSNPRLIQQDWQLQPSSFIDTDLLALPVTRSVIKSEQK